MAPEANTDKLDHLAPSPETLGRWPKNWQLGFRASEILLHRFADGANVLERRRRDGRVPVRAASTAEARRFREDVAPLVAWLQERWCALFDQWAMDPAGYIFDDGYAALFLLLGLYAGSTVVLRGQLDATWRITTSLQRTRERSGEAETRRALRLGELFVERASRWQPLLYQYPNGIPPQEAEALKQHYGFPTDYVDVTFAYDVALFFAEDWVRPWNQPDARMPALGAIYAVPIHIVQRNSALVTLPQAVMRPSLQFGKFVRGDNPGFRAELESYKFVYRHFGVSVACGLSRPGFETEPPLSQYLYPVSDPLDALARELRSSGNSGSP